VRRVVSFRLAVLIAIVAPVLGCKPPEAQLRLQFAGGPDACHQQTSLRCVNYLQFTAGMGEFSSHCSRVEVELIDLCDLAKVAEGQEVFKLSPDTPLPITIEGLRVYPAIGCNSSGACPPRRIFAGTTVGRGTIGDYTGRVIDLPVTVLEPCGLPEEFFFLPEGGTCAEVCGTSPVVCDHVAGGCLCKGPPGSSASSGTGGMDGGQGGIDASP
jgi:hypothetical protein